MIMTRAIFVLVEILCFYQILRGINGFKATENLFYIFTNRQWIRWGSILLLFGYVIGISILWHYHTDLALNLGFIGFLLIPIIIVTIWRTNIKKIWFSFSFFMLTTAFPMIVFYHWLSFPTVVVSLINLFFVSVLVEFKIVYKVYLFISKRSILLYSLCLVATLWILIAFLSERYEPRNAVFVSIVGLLFAFITIYSIKKYTEIQFINNLKEQSYPEIKVRLEKKSIRVIETDKIDIYELHSFWFPKQLSYILTQEFERLGLTIDIIKEREQIKIHLFKN